MEGLGHDYTRGENWKVASIEGKGMGVIATADIKQGELTLHYKDLIAKRR